MNKFRNEPSSVPTSNVTASFWIYHVNEFRYRRINFTWWIPIQLQVPNVLRVSSLFISMSRFWFDESFQSFVRRVIYLYFWTMLRTMLCTNRSVNLEIEEQDFRNKRIVWWISIVNGFNWSRRWIHGAPVENHVNASVMGIEVLGWTNFN